MSEQTTLVPAGDRGWLQRITSDAQYRRAIAGRSGISEVTLRRIGQTGKVQSYATAVALEHASGGEIRADEITDGNAKGARFYQNRSARALLDQAMKEGVTLARLLGRHALTTSDLWAFVNAEEGKCSDVKKRVSGVLQDLGLPIDQDDTQ